MIKEYYDTNYPKRIFKSMLSDIFLKGQELVSELSQVYVESPYAVVMTVTNPSIGSTRNILPEEILEYFPTSLLEKYAINVASALPEEGDWEYTYGERLSRKNQLSECINKLQEFPETRRATVVLRLPQDIYSDNPPCMTVIDFKIRDGGLNVFAWFRSNDALFGWPANYLEVLYVGARVSGEVDVPLKQISTMSQSMHYYKRSEDLVKLII